MKATILLISSMCVSCASVSNSTNSITDENKKNKLKVLIVDGQNNHTVWPKSTVMMKQYLEETNLFDVEIYRTKPTWNGNNHPKYYALHSDHSHFDVKKPEIDRNFKPNFNNYDVVVSNLGYKAAIWPKETKIAFETYVESGGGFVTVHAADNAFPKWTAYNKMIGLGGWAGRNEKDGPYVYYNDDDVLITDTKAGKGGTHGKRHELQIINRVEHPILNGLPNVWMHTKDECYGKLRGPAENLTVLSTALCPKDKNGTGRHEPMLMTINYGDGRVFHTTLGHDDYSFESVGFITTFLRGVEWAATGAVTQDVPFDFPSKNLSSKREFELTY